MSVYLSIGSCIATYNAGALLLNQIKECGCRDSRCYKQDYFESHLELKPNNNDSVDVVQKVRHAALLHVVLLHVVLLHVVLLHAALLHVVLLHAGWVQTPKLNLPRTFH